MNFFIDEGSSANHRRSVGIGGVIAPWLSCLFASGRKGVAAFAGSGLLMTSAAMAIDIPSLTTTSDFRPGPVGEGIVSGAQTVDRGESVLRFYCNEHFANCDIGLECATYDGQMTFEGIFSPLAARNGRTVETDELAEVISWDRESGLTCRVWSEQDATVQQLQRHPDGRLTVITGWSESLGTEMLDISGVEIGRYQSALIHSIKSPAGTSPSNEEVSFTIFCRAPKGEDCGCSTTIDPACEAKDQVWLSCSEDDGTVHEGRIGRIPRHARIFMDEEAIAEIIEYRWEGRGLSCEVRSDHRVGVAMSDYIAGRRFANQSASLPRMPVDDTPPRGSAVDDPFLLPIRAYAYAIPSSESRDQADLLMYCNDEHHHCPAWLECTTQSGAVLGDRASSSTDDRFHRRAHLVIPPRGVHRMSASEIEETITKASWAGEGRLSCAIRSDKDIRAQVWMRSGLNPQTNNTHYIRSEEASEIDGGAVLFNQVARVHSIPAPSDLDVSNIRIHCTAAAGERCGCDPATDGRYGCYEKNRLRIGCSEDDGTVHEGTLDPLDSGSIRHIKAAELAEIIDHRWEGIALACEVRSDQPFNLQLLTRTGDEGVLLNGGMAVQADNPNPSR